MDISCEVCGAKITGFDSCRDVYNKLSFYTLSRPDQKFFIHQCAVDAYAAQHASENTKPITTAFALIGLNLFVNYHYTGKQVQNAHIELAKNKREWPVFIQPEKKAKITVADALKAKHGEERDQMIKEWAIAVWDMWKNQHGAVMELLTPYLTINEERQQKNKIS